jgi:hypothetical protein
MTACRHVVILEIDEHIEFVDNPPLKLSKGSVPYTSIVPPKRKPAVTVPEDHRIGANLTLFHPVQAVEDSLPRFAAVVPNQHIGEYVSGMNSMPF